MSAVIRKEHVLNGKPKVFHTAETVENVLYKSSSASIPEANQTPTKYNSPELKFLNPTRNSNQVTVISLPERNKADGSLRTYSFLRTVNAPNELKALCASLKANVQQGKVSDQSDVCKLNSDVELACTTELCKCPKWTKEKKEREMVAEIERKLNVIDKNENEKEEMIEIIEVAVNVMEDPMNVIEEIVNEDDPMNVIEEIVNEDDPMNVIEGTVDDIEISVNVLGFECAESERATKMGCSILADRSFQSENSFVCAICDIEFHKKSELITHVRSHTADHLYSFSNRTYDEKFDSKIELRDNKIVVGFTCPICNQVFVTKTELHMHTTKTHCDDKQYVCPVCMKAFTRNSDLLVHKNVHFVRPYVCQQCDKSFNENRQLQRHINRTHTDDKPFRCEKCDKAFRELRHLVRHHRIHTGEKPFSCRICHKTFSDSSHLNRHMKTHTGEKPYACTVCEKKFSEKANLIMHMRTHTGDKPYQCQHCEKMFSQNVVLMRHMEIHNGEKPHKCPLCGLSFRHKNLLKTHSDEHKLYICIEADCGKGFTTEALLDRHSKSHVSQEEDVDCEPSANIVNKVKQASKKPRSVKKDEANKTTKHDHVTRMVTHMGVKHFMCTDCGKAFRRAGDLAEHVQSSHSGNTQHDIDQTHRKKSKVETVFK